MEVMQQTPSAPSVIRIKRKRDDAPLDSLYLENRKRRATDHTYVFKRLEQEQKVLPVVKQEYDDSGIPKIRSTPEGEEKRDPYALGRSRNVQTPTKLEKGKDVASSEPRRFHLSRAMSVSAAAKGKSDVATFVERRGSAQNGISQTGTSGSGNTPIAVMTQRSLKRPSARSRMTQGGSGTATPLTGSQVDLAMAEKMSQWSQQTSEQEAARHADRTTKAQELGVEAMDLDNEADYVYDTYYRQALAAGEQLPDAKEGISFGHLVIGEEDEDLWETYLDDEGSDDKEFETDDEDSNAEDYYGADYPEDEVASDDEFDRDTYQYRQNADDLEEFDVHERETYEVDDRTFYRSDDEDADSRLQEARAWKTSYGKAARGENMVL